MPDVEHKARYENIVDNYRRAGKEDDPKYIEALRQLELCRTKHLDFNKTMSLVTERAKERKFVSYEEVATVNGIEMKKIHYQIGKHLEHLCEYAHRKGWPLLSAIVVNVDRLKTGEMKPGSRSGFIEAARKLGIPVANENEFVKLEQEKVFDWAASEPIP